MKPQCRPKVGQIERSGCSYSRKYIGLAKVQCEVAENEETHIVLQTLDGVFILLWLQTTISRQSHQIPLALEYQKNAGDQLGSDGFFG